MELTESSFLMLIQNFLWFLDQRDDFQRQKQECQFQVCKKSWKTLQPFKSHLKAHSRNLANFCVDMNPFIGQSQQLRDFLVLVWDFLWFWVLLVFCLVWLGVFLCLVWFVVAVVFCLVWFFISWISSKWKILLAL